MNKKGANGSESRTVVGMNSTCDVLKATRNNGNNSTRCHTPYTRQIKHSKKQNGYKRILLHKGQRENYKLVNFYFNNDFISSFCVPAPPQSALSTFKKYKKQKKMKENIKRKKRKTKKNTHRKNKKNLIKE